MRARYIARLRELAAHDRQRSNTLYRHDARFHSVIDPIEAEVLRLRCELYNALADGEGWRAAFDRAYEQAKAACERYNKAQEPGQSRTWHPTDSGYFGPDEAWTRLWHAVTTYRAMHRARVGRQRLVHWRYMVYAKVVDLRAYRTLPNWSRTGMYRHLNQMRRTKMLEFVNDGRSRSET